MMNFKKTAETSFKFVSLINPYGSFFRKQYIGTYSTYHQGDLFFLQFSISIKIKIIADYVDPGITQIALHCPMVFC